MRKMGTTKNMVKAPKYNLSDLKIVIFLRQPKGRLKGSHPIMSVFSLDEKNCVENVAGLKIIADTMSDILYQGKMAECRGRSVFLRKCGLYILENSGNSSK
jgi:hypothetical protein